LDSYWLSYGLSYWLRGYFPWLFLGFLLGPCFFFLGTPFSFLFVFIGSKLGLEQLTLFLKFLELLLKIV